MRIRLARRLLFTALFVLVARAAGAQPVTIELYGIASGGWQPVLDDFQRLHPDVTVKWSKYGVDDLKQALKVAASSRRMPTLWYNWGGTLQSQYDQAGVALDLTEALRQANITANLKSAAVSLASDGGRLYGMPYRLIPMSIFYRTDVFAGAGLAPPKSWTEFEQVLAALKAKGVTPFATGGKFGWMTMRYVDLLLEHYAGPALHDRLKSLDASWKDPAVVQAYGELRAWADKGYFNSGFLGVDPTTAPTLLYDGKCAMILDNPGIEAGRLIPDHVDESKWGIFVAPTDRTPNRFSGYITQLQVAMNATPEQRQAAIAFLAFIGNRENAAKYLRTLGGPSAVNDVAVPESLPLSRRWEEILDAGVAMFPPSDQALPQMLVNTYFQTNDQVLLGTLTPEQAAAQMDDAISEFKAQR